MYSTLRTRWDIANTPLRDIPLFLFPKNKLVYFVGQSSTGKSTIASRFRAKFPRINIQGEFARSIMEKERWKRSDLENDKIFLALQRLIVEKHKELLSSVNRDFAIVDRSVIDTLFFCRQRFGKEFVQDLEFEIFRICEEMKQRAIVIHFPFEPKFIDDDGIRLLPSAENEALFRSCLRDVNIKFHTLLALNQEERVQEILNVISAESKKIS